MNGYIGFYGSKKHEFQAETSYNAYLQAITFFKVPKSKLGLLNVVLAEVDSKQVTTHVD